MIDRITKENYEFPAKVIFLCASTVASTAILMQSKSDRFPDGMGNDSGQLGRNIMDHHLDVGASGSLDGYEDKYYRGRKANGIYIPRFRNLGGKSNTDKFIRGYGYQGSGSRGNWQDTIKELSHGKDLKEAILKPGGWRFGMSGFGEVLPYEDNRMYLDYDKLDQWGLPTVTFDAVTSSSSSFQSCSSSPRSPVWSWPAPPSSTPRGPTPSCQPQRWWR